MSLSLGYSPLILAALLAAAACAAWWMYRSTVPVLGSGIRSLLGSLRFLALGVLLFLLVEPLLQRTVRRSVPPVVAVVLDGSGSMSLARPDGSGPRAADQARAIAGSLTASLPEIDLRWFTFDESVRPAGADFVPDSLRFDAGVTDLAGALSRVEDDLQPEALSGVIVVSDGRYNSGRNPLHVADRYRVPVHTIAVGDTASQRDIQVRNIVTNEVAYRGRELPFDVSIRHRGFGGRQVSVLLEQDGVVVDRSATVLPESDGAVPLTLTAIPEEAGLRRFRISVSTLDGELTTRNNAGSVAVRVLESRRRVLLVGDAPSPDLSSLRGLLEADIDLEVITRVQRGSTGFFEGALPDPASFDLIALVGYPGSGAVEADLSSLATAAARVPLFFQLTRGTDPLLLQRLASVLPGSAEAARPGFSEARIVPVAEGRSHPVLLDPNASTPDPWGILPPLRVTDGRWTAAPDARILAVPEIRGIGLDDPVLLVRRRSGVRSAMLLATGTWQWANLPEDLDAVSGLWPGAVERLVHWLVAPEDDRPVRVRPVRDAFEGGTEIEFTGQVYDESLAPVPDAAVEVEVITPDGRTLPYALRPVGKGLYAGRFGALPEGSYSYRARAVREAEVLGEDSGSFAVGPLSLEYRDVGADVDLMRQIALRTGGVALQAGDAASLADSLARRGALEPTVRTADSAFRLWEQVPFLLLVLVLLTVEWFLRKRRGLV